MNFNYALDNYSWESVLVWGNFRSHFEKASDSNASLGHRVVHALIATAEFLPIIGQIASIFEKIIVEYFSKHELPKVNSNLSDRKISAESEKKENDKLDQADKEITAELDKKESDKPDHQADRKISDELDKKENDNPYHEDTLTGPTQATQSSVAEIKKNNNLNDPNLVEIDDLLEDAQLSVQKGRLNFLKARKITPDEPCKFEILPQRKKELVNVIAARVQKENADSVRFKKCLGKNEERTLEALKEKAIPQIVDCIINFLNGRIESNINNSGGSKKITTYMKLITVRTLKFGMKGDSEYEILLNSIGEKLKKLEIKEESKKKLFAASIVDAVLVELAKGTEIYHYNPRFYEGIISGPISYYSCIFC